MTSTTESRAETLDESTMLARLPRSLSPSRASDFANCPKAFYFKTIEKRYGPPTLANAIGTLSHLVYERVFDFPRQERTVEMAHSLIPDAWEAMSGPGAQYYKSAQRYRELAPEGSEAHAELFQGTREAVERWFQMERVGNFDPERREMGVNTVIDGVPVAGVLDRLDSFEVGADGERRRVWTITDYKSGKVPGPRYEDEAFEPMALYAYALWKSKGIVVDQLRLVYTRTGDRVNGIKTRTVTSEMVHAAAARMVRIRGEMEAACATNSWPAKVGPLCGWCPFTELCPQGAAEVARRNPPVVEATS